MGEYKVVDEKVVSFDIAKQLKEAGFDERVLGIYMHTPSSSIGKGGYFNSYKSYVHHSNTEWQELFNAAKETLYKGLDAKHPNISAPTHFQVLNWLEERGVYVYAEWHDYFWVATIISKAGENRTGQCRNRIEAYEKAFALILRRSLISNKNE